MKKNFSNNDRYVNRELSWIEFNKRVLNAAERAETPLFEKAKFLSIVSSNFDEFFMVRVGSLHDQLVTDKEILDCSGMTPKEQMDKIFIYSRKLLERQYRVFNGLKKELEDENIEFASIDDISSEQRRELDRYYHEVIFPVLTPILVDKTAHVPLILNQTLNIAVLLKSERGNRYMGTIQVPSVLSRLVEVPNSGDKKVFIPLEEIISENLGDLYSGHEVLDSFCYRITRNADLTLEEEGAEDLLEVIEESIKKRKRGSVVRLEVESTANGHLLKELKSIFEITDEYIIRVNGYIDLTFLMKMKLEKLNQKPSLRYRDFVGKMNPAFREGESIFDSISRQDILTHHPYELFDPVVRLVQEAAKDPNVLAIKQVLYRVSGNSPIVKALIEAAEAGKQVTVLMELKARFDEESNIVWAKRLEKAGCHVIYGVEGLKVHCKILLIVRMEETGIRRYVHLGTGNYNDVTANIYTDLGYFTANPYIGADASNVFNMLSGHSKLENMYKLHSSPTSLRKRIEKGIEREVQNAMEGKPAKIIIKVNSLVDVRIIDKLYEASQAGVKISLIIRGICCLIPNVKGLSENISVTSIVGRYLEHSRIYYFYNDGEEDIFISSADLMSRNLDRRIELLNPIEDRTSKEKIKEILEVSLKDNVNAKTMASDGRYMKHRGGEAAVDSHEYFQTHTVKDVPLSSYMLKPIR